MKGDIGLLLEKRESIDMKSEEAKKQKEAYIKEVYILGISCFYHDSSAALLRNGKIVAAVAEERFSRKKHDSSFPLQAIMYCLAAENITIKDVDAIGFYEKPFMKFERMLSQQFETFPWSMKSFVQAIPSWITEKLKVPQLIQKRLKYKGEIFFIEHHLAHAASAFLLSPFEKAAIVTVDGVGEWTTTTYGYGQGNEIGLHKEIKFPHSIGLFYSTITAYLGFSVNNAEYKVMGLSAYGVMDKEKNEYYTKLKRVIDIKEDGSFELDMEYFAYQYGTRMPSEKLCSLLGGPVSKREGALTQRHKDIAAALQMITEEALTKILCHVHAVTTSDNVVLAGGVALNSVYNGKILKQTPFKNVWIQPDAGDGGTSMGVAAYVYNAILGKKRECVMENAYLGPQFTNEEIEHFLKSNNIIYKKYKTEKDIIDTVAKLLHENVVVGWFQGRMEVGPRALGARSILANPTHPKMQEILNVKVKHREKFRPFAPVICVEDAQNYFDCDLPVPASADFMLMVYPIKKKWQEKLPAVTHVDGSGRVQTVRRFQNPAYYDLIQEFGKVSGVPILINTSFNIRGEPIVCSPYDAYKCMMGTEIDYVCMGNFLIKRSDNLRDVWDSEKYAVD